METKYIPECLAGWATEPDRAPGDLPTVPETPKIPIVERESALFKEMVEIYAHWLFSEVGCPHSSNPKVLTYWAQRLHMFTNKVCHPLAQRLEGFLKDLARYIRYDKRIMRQYDINARRDLHVTGCEVEAEAVAVHGYGYHTTGPYLMTIELRAIRAAQNVLLAAYGLDLFNCQPDGPSWLKGIRRKIESY
jgi:hypothetical protein